MTRRLTGTDSLFLAGETLAWHQHVGGLTIVDPAGVDGFSFESVFARIEERLPLVPKLMWKLKEVPLRLDRAIWVDDTEFDLRRHVHYASVDAPGGPRETARAVAPILSEQIDRRYPLWEIWFLAGLANGRVGVLMKFHHSLLDGGAGAVLAAMFLDLSPSPEPTVIPELPEPEPTPSDLTRLLDGVIPSLTSPLRAVRYGARMAQRGVQLVRHFGSGNRAPDLAAIVRAPKTSFNGAIGPRRAMAFSSISLNDVKALRRHFDVKINDIALALCSGALRTYLIDRNELPEQSLTVGVPVSTRAESDTSLDNQVSYIAVALATSIADPEARLRAIVGHTETAKGMNQVLRANPVGSLADTAPPFVIARLLRFVYETHLLSYVPGMMNTIVSISVCTSIPISSKTLG